MADSKISDLVDGTPPVASTDYVVIARGADNYKISFQDFITLVRDHLENGGTTELDVAGLSGELADNQPPKAHKTSHENGGTDEMSVAGLSGLLADAQTPLTENVEDIVGALIQDSADLDVTYDDGTPSVTAIIKNDAVTYAKMQNVSATSRFLGRITASAGDPEELTGTQATTLLDAFTSLLKGLAPASGGGTTNYLRADGSWAEPPGTGGGGFSPYFADHTDYNTDSTENNIFTGTVTGNDLGATGGIIFIILGSMQINSGSCTLTIRLKFGATTMFGDVSAAITNDADRRAVVIIGGIWNNGATNAQHGVLLGIIGTAIAGSVAGIGDFAAIATATATSFMGSGTATEDTTADKTLSVSTTFSVSNAAVGISVKGMALKI